MRSMCGADAGCLAINYQSPGKGSFETGVTAPGSEDHTILVALSWTSPWAEKRQWVLDFGQWDGRAEHWLWQGD